MFGLGYKPDQPKAPGEKPDFDARSRIGAAAIPARASNRNLITSVLNQGGLSSCVAHAVTQAVRASHVKQGVDHPALASRLMLYYLARAQLGETELDEGTFIRLAFQSLNKFGFCPETLWPYTDQGPAWKTKPALEAFRAAMDQRNSVAVPTAYYRIYETGRARVDAVKMALAAGHCVAFGTDVSTDFCAGRIGTGPVSPPNDQPIAGGHAMCIVGYDGDVFDVVNSWGEGWGWAGYWPMTADYLVWGPTEDLWIVEAAPYYSGGTT